MAAAAVTLLATAAIFGSTPNGIDQLEAHAQAPSSTTAEPAAENVGDNSARVRLPRVKLLPFRRG
ncbi:hypothetical protein F3N42_02775 [Marinihelvus fidelis]|uniref:Uncharacterized protein n=1 Tax=Marinihelvus fidelis TaxID=2613842 RepID=A0A5N0TDX3_9GAMM|nr:hypothetical protein F3N42_02775 [Marinihelvus fidelis]